MSGWSASKKAFLKPCGILQIENRVLQLVKFVNTMVFKKLFFGGLK
ncbi:MAG: hypothetical protein XD78_0977 [Desulfotomaculum sp. 46_296]|nr:MAG: hypothetical protein XD78_0977 [Desulfotomaculum sp. 46_296]